MTTGRVWIGTSGWTYESWQGAVYPAGVSGAARLSYYATELFDTVELNASYYRWPSDATFTGWNRRLPPGFRMTVKAPRALTHARMLKEPGRWLDIMQRGIGLLADRFGVLLVQLPPGMSRDDNRLDSFLTSVPPSWPTAVEFRHPSWECEDVYDLLQSHGASYVVKSGAGQQCILRSTAPRVYLRFHGPGEHLYAGSYSDDDLWWWAGRIREWQQQGREVWAYFNNDMEGFAVRNATSLRSALAAQGGDAT